MKKTFLGLLCGLLALAAAGPAWASGSVLSCIGGLAYSCIGRNCQRWSGMDFMCSSAPTAPTVPGTGSVDNDFIRNNFEPTRQVPGPGEADRFGVMGPDGPMAGDRSVSGWWDKTDQGNGPYDTWKIIDDDGGKNQARGNLPGWAGFQKKAWDARQKLVQRMARLREVMDQNRKEMEKWKELRNRLAGQAMDGADKARENFFQGARDQLGGQLIDGLGDASEWAAKVFEFKEYADNAQALAEGGVENLAQQLIEGPVGLFWWMGDTMDDYFNARGLDMDLDHLNGLMDDINQAQQQLDRFAGNLEAELANLDKAIEAVENAGFTGTDSQQAMDRFNQALDATEFLTGELDMTVRVITPGKTSHTPGVTGQYSEATATFTVLGPGV